MSSVTEYVDVLIIGAGPAGLTTANCFNGSNLNVRVVDKKAGPLKTGRADGLKSISMEVLDSFGVGDIILSECQRCEEIVLWDPDQNGNIKRTVTIADRVEELHKPREVLLDQGRIEIILCDNLAKHNSVDIQWSRQPVDVQVDLALKDNPEAYPVTVTLYNLLTDSHETIRTKYLVGCDGARSWLRKFLNIKFTGDLTDSTWGVLNMIPKTNFPDIRKVFVVHSSKGTVMGVPREDKMVRFYISMDGGHRNTSLDASSITAEAIVEAARAIMAPYTLEAAAIPWWSAYCVGQRVADEFSRHDRVFLAGDAVHTHSPKAGQGMNTSIQDGYNIGWKLRYCLEQKCDRSLLSTYQKERRPIAQALIDFDREYLEFFARADITHDEFLKGFLAAMKFTTGIGIQYGPSLVVQDGTAAPILPLENPATNLLPGKRLPDFQMVNQSDGVPVLAHHRFTCDGRFRVLVFAGDIASTFGAARLQRLGGLLEEQLKSRSGLEVVTIHSSKRSDVEFMDLPPVFRPWDDAMGWDYWSVYADDDSYHDGHGHAYRRCGIDSAQGCLVVLRPDGYMSLVCALDEVQQVFEFLDGLAVKAPMGTAFSGHDESKEVKEAAVTVLAGAPTLLRA